MGAQVRVKVLTPDGRPVFGAHLSGENREAWKKARDAWELQSTRSSRSVLRGLETWVGTTDRSGAFLWTDLNTESLGDPYTFSARHTDTHGVEWAGEVRRELQREMEVTIVVQPAEPRQPHSPEPTGRDAAREMDTPSIASRARVSQWEFYRADSDDSP